MKATAVIGVVVSLPKPDVEQVAFKIKSVIMKRDITPTVLKYETMGMDNKYNRNLDKQSIYLLQLIDCNCNDCFHMERDFFTYGKWEALERIRQNLEFDRKKAEALKIAEACEDPQGKQTLMHAWRKMRFMFDRQYLLNYGNCKKLNKPVSFIPNICQLETQQCFEHRLITQDGGIK